jgi:hypothetical protein
MPIPGEFLGARKNGDLFLARSVSEGDHDGPRLPNIGDTLNSRPFPPRAVVSARGRFGARSFRRTVVFVVPLAYASG